MNPPVSYGIQGAYVVAIVMTGTILGAASLLLTEMTEGLGCLFGGFCVAMWLLVLKPGGLVSSTPSVVVFIVCFTIAGWGTSFSHLTRSYGLVGLLPFGGATVVVMGIDCFSRAGLKEFWAYIWNLNQNIFPLGATTYPLTRGIKVEIAAIVIIYLIGLASQSKLWNIVKQRRERRAPQRNLTGRDVGREEEKVGRRVENATCRQRAYWEAIYGNKNNAPSSGSGTDSITTAKEGPTATVTPIQHSHDEQVEMEVIPTSPATDGHVLSTKANRQSRLLATDDNSVSRQQKGMSFMETRNNRMTQMSSRNTMLKNNRASTTTEHLRLDLDGEGRLETLRRESQVISSPSPAVVPLPFTVRETEDDDKSSVATFAGDEKTHRLSKRLSQGSGLLRSLSQRSHLKPHRLSRPLSSSTEQLVEADDGDGRSSVAATVDYMSEDDNLNDLPEASPKSSLTENNSNKEDSGQSATEGSSQPVYASPLTAGFEAQSTLESETHDPKPPLSLSVQDKETSGEVSANALPAIERQLVALTKEALPTAMPRVASSYRTNEWAKHISDAEAPEIEDIQSSVDAEDEEVPTQVFIKDLTPAESDQVRPVSRSASQAPGLAFPPKVARQNSTQSLHSNGLEPPAASHSKVIVSRPVSQHSIQNQLSPRLQSMRSYRNSSTPNIGQTLVESPIEDHFEAFPDSNTLLGKRDSILRNKSAMGFSSLSPTREAVTRASSIMQGSHYSARSSMMRQSSTPAIPQIAAFDSHQPQHKSSTPVNGQARDFQMAQWRASMQQDLQSNVQPKKSLDRSRSALLQERMILERQKETEQMNKSMRDSMYDERMRKGDMLDAHREAMRKMQQEANKHLS
jgi:hypothetical protein